ncbi:MAG: hypothetical protein ABEK17_04760 [Candidatus Aenigmatarchaeota archaeon]
MKWKEILQNVKKGEPIQFKSKGNTYWSKFCGVTQRSVVVNNGRTLIPPENMERIVSKLEWKVLYKEYNLENRSTEMIKVDHLEVKK